MSFDIPNNLANELSNGILANKEKLLLREYQRALGNIRSQLQKAYTKYGQKGTLSLNVMSKYGRLEKMEEQVVQEMNKVLHKVDTHIKSSIKGTFKSTYYGDSYLLSEATNSDFNMAILNEKKLKAVLDNKYDRIGWPARLQDNVNQTTKQLRSEISQGVIQGYSYRQVSQRVSDRLGIGAYKSHRIIRTESHRAQEMGHMQTREELSKLTEDTKAEVYKIWDATLDLRTRPEHGALDGQKVKKEQDFELGGYSAPAPGLFGVAYMDINCRCTTRTHVKHPEFESTEPEKSYSQWYENKTGKKPKFTKRIKDKDAPVWYNDPTARRFKNPENSRYYVKQKNKYKNLLDDTLSGSERNDLDSVGRVLRAQMRDDDDLKDLMENYLEDWQRNAETTGAKLFRKKAFEMEDLRTRRAVFRMYNIDEASTYGNKVKQISDEAYIKLRAINQTYMDNFDGDTINLYRGTNGGHGRKVVGDLLENRPNQCPIVDKALSGYSTSEDIAEGFGSGYGGFDVKYTFEMDEVVLHKDLFSKFTGSYGHEKECIMIGINKRISVKNMKFKSADNRWSFFGDGWND